VIFWSRIDTFFCASFSYKLSCSSCQVLQSIHLNLGVNWVLFLLLSHLSLLLISAKINVKKLLRSQSDTIYILLLSYCLHISFRLMTRVKTLHCIIEHANIQQPLHSFPLWRNFSLVIVYSATISDTTKSTLLSWMRKYCYLVWLTGFWL